MTMTSTPADEVSRYVADVAAHLGGLDPDERAELLDDLQQHLLEVAAEPGPPLHERLGPPADYAAELLGSVGADPAGASDKPPLRTRAGDLGRRLGLPARWAEARRFLGELRPAWWVLRGLLLAWVGLRLLVGHATNAALLVIPSPRGNVLAGLAVTAVGIAASLALARRTGPGHGGRRLLAAANVALVLAAAPLLQKGLEHTVVFYESAPAAAPGPSCLANGAGVPIGNLYPYDSEGHPLDRVLLYDQSGRPLNNLCPADVSPQGYRVQTDYARDANGARVINVFPRSQTVLGPTPAPVPPPAIVIPKLAPPGTTTTTTTTTQATTTTVP
ncbi:MAG TPA: hypothetical protein VGO92_02980 [Acidimicrobiales bacterium]|jgi:hypothetical protein|nr:hypothetical protein [Acidimicrobiales bacterium]